MKGRNNHHPSESSQINLIYKSGNPTKPLLVKKIRATTIIYVSERLKLLDLLAFG